MQTDDKQARKTLWGKGITTFRLLIFMAVILLVGAGALLIVNTSRQPAEAEVLVYKSPACGCCEKWVQHLRATGFKVVSKDTDDLDAVKSSYGVPQGLRSCHTAVVAGYVIEGHVPAEDIRRLLRERPAVAGLAAPGMPMGSPGMEGNHTEPYTVLAFDRSGRSETYVHH